MTAPDTLPPDLAELGELLREDPPRPAPRWARSLDDRVAAGFPRPPRRARWTRSRKVRRALLPAMGFACVLVLAVGVATLTVSGDDESAFLGGGTSESGGGGASSAAQSGGGSSGGLEDSSGASSEDPGTASPSLVRPRSIPPAPGGGSPGSDARRARKQERSAALTLAARPREIETVADGILRVTDSVGGFVASSSVASGSAAGGTFELRIPSARLPKAIADLSRLAHVRERTQASRDITAQSVSARDRLREARREREGLLRALARATTLNETESIKARLRTVNGQIASARASVRRVDNRAAYANVSVALVGDRDSGATDEDGQWTPGEAFDDAVRVLEVAAGIALIALAVALPLAIVALLAALASRVAGRRRRERALDAA